MKGKTNHWGFQRVTVLSGIDRTAISTPVDVVSGTIQTHPWIMECTADDMECGFKGFCSKDC